MHRVVLVSHTYIPASTRGKLRALAARGLDVTVGVPQHWREAGLGRTLEIGWERQNGVEVFPIPARYHGSADTLRFAGRALLALLRDKRPDLIQVEEEPTSRAAPQTCLWPWSHSSACTPPPLPTTCITRGSRSGAWDAWCRRRDSVLCCRRWPRFAPC